MSNNPCSCIGSRFELVVDQISPDYVIIHDLSDWVVDEGFTYPDSFFIEVLSDKEEKTILEVFPENGYVISNEAFDDGVYKFTIDNCGKKYSQSFLFYAKTQCRLDVGFVKSDNNRDLKALKDVQDDLDMAKLSARSGNYTSAKEIVKKANIKLDNINCDCSCK